LSSVGLNSNFNNLVTLSTIKVVNYKPEPQILSEATDNQLETPKTTSHVDFDMKVVTSPIQNDVES
jgi:hypothetical protein